MHKQKPLCTILNHSLNMQLSVKPLGSEEVPVTLLERANPFLIGCVAFHITSFFIINDCVLFQKNEIPDK
jgi:hypothetical protein